MNDENFKINEKNKPRIFANTIKIDNKINSINISISIYVILERMINVHPGQYKHQKCFTIIIKKQFITIMQ